ncbi:MAG: DUF6790 family protein [Pseudomonadota bacterium]
MYFAIIALTMFVLPLASAVLEHNLHPGADWPLLTGRWFVFWAVGVRLLLAGARQYLKPGFTMHEIFRLKDDAALPLVRELGGANLSIGVVGLLSLAAPSFVLPAAIYAVLFYAVAAWEHIGSQNRNFNETLALVSDIFAVLVLAIFIVAALI